MRLICVLMLSLLVPIGSLDYFSINFDDDKCLAAYEGLARAFGELRHNSTENKGRLALSMLSATKIAYKSCIFYTVDLPSSIKKSMQAYSSLGEAIGALANFAGSNSGDTSLAINEILAGINNKDVKRLQYMLRILIGMIVKNTKKGDVTEGVQTSRTLGLAQTKDGIVSFVKYSGLLSPRTPQACLVRVDALVQQALEAGSMIWTLSDLLRGIEKLLSLDEHIEGMMTTCPELTQHVVDLVIHSPHFEWTSIAQNVFKRSGLIGSNFYNAYIAIESKNWGKVGAWLGLGIFNVFSPISYDDELLSSVYDG